MLRTFFTCATLIAVVILLGCTSDNRGTLPDADFFVRQGQPFALRVGDTAGIQTPASIALVRFAAVLEDTRCPIDVECVAPGHATLLVSVQSALNAQDVEIQVPPNGGGEAQVEELKVEALELRPPRQEGVEIDSLRYEAAFRVTQTIDLSP